MSISAITGTFDPTASQTTSALDLYKWRFPTATTAFNFPSVTTPDSALLQTSTPLDLFKQRFPSATEVLTSPGTAVLSTSTAETLLNAVDPVLSQTSVLDSLGSLNSTAATTTATQTDTTQAAIAPVDQGAMTAAELSLLSADATAAQAILEEQNAAHLAAAQLRASIQAEEPDGMPALLRGAYLAPVVSSQFTAPYRGGLSASVEETMKDVSAATPVSPLADYANGQPFNPNARFLHTPAPETVAAHLKRLAHDKALEPIGPQIVSGTYGVLKPHLLDELA